MNLETWERSLAAAFLAVVLPGSGVLDGTPANETADGGTGIVTDEARARIEQALPARAIVAPKTNRSPDRKSSVSSGELSDKDKTIP